MRERERAREREREPEREREREREEKTRVARTTRIDLGRLGLHGNDQVIAVLARVFVRVFVRVFARVVAIMYLVFGIVCLVFALIFFFFAIVLFLFLAHSLTRRRTGRIRITRALFLVCHRGLAASRRLCAVGGPCVCVCVCVCSRVCEYEHVNTCTGVHSTNGERDIYIDR